MVSLSTVLPIMAWVDSLVHGIYGGGELRIDLLNYNYDSNIGFYVFDFKVFNGYVEFINLIDVSINGLSFKGFGENAYFSQLSQLEYDFGMISSRNYANKFYITILGKSTIYLKLYLPKTIFNNNCMNFTFRFIKGYDSSKVLSVEVAMVR
ncbi:MAG: hypothetical protein QW743_04825 [Candidatus Methanomethylicia archaeon]